MSQKDKVLKYLKQTGTITQREALLDLSVQSLTKRISELRRDGHDIESKTRHHPVTGQRYCRYFYHAPSSKKANPTQRK